ncbi:MAG TPA: translocation/assembly module TamB domain-containing protein [Gemmatimonadaceae bacterium]|jgi:translocation and assembly module TamB|nr:translocation/assembly module TamB domain-containing protein [Gemmatimonadaceae bacterium]
MTRRRFIAIVSLCVLVTLGVIVAGTGWFVTQSDFGQEQLRRWIQAQLASSVHGTVHLGRISGSFLTGVTIDSVELRDDQDSLFVATGRVHVEYDPRDLVDRRLHLRRVDVEHPNVVLRQSGDFSWNFKRMFKRSGPQRPKGPERGFGDFIVADAVHLRDAQMRLTLPWHVDTSLHGVKRDSATRFNLARTDHEIRRTGDGFSQNYRWTGAYLAVSHARLADPDTAERLFVVDTLHAVESVPSFRWRNVRAVVRQLGDSVWISAPHWDLPASTGHAEGKIVWGSELPVRYGIRVWGDSVSLADVGWVYPTLPTTGGGTMVLDIRNEKNLQRLDYAISDMDVRTTRSRLLGDMTFETGGPVLAVHDVKLRADPVDFDLLRTLNGKPFPADWQGTITGTVNARGGPLTHFYVDDANVTFRDAHVPGAESHLRGRGELDILFPAFTAFHHFTAQTDRLDLRTLVAIYPAFPRMTGIVSGSAVLDSSWLDVRVSNASLTHTDGPAEPTHMTGGGRVTYGVQFMTYDLTLQADPLSLTTLSRSYPKLPLRGTFAGPLTVRGTAPALQVTADLTGAAGHVTYTGAADADSIGGYGAQGSGTFDALDAAALVGRTTPPSRLAGTYDVDLTGDLLSNLAGSLAVRLDRSVVDGIHFAEGMARAQFDAGVMRLDTLRLDGQAGTLTASGALGLTRPSAGDSLVARLVVDSLGGLRRYLAGAPPASGDSAARVAPDSLGGRLESRVVVRGWLDSLDVRGTLEGRDLLAGTQRAEGVHGTIDVRQVLGHTQGTLSLLADSAMAGGLRIRSASLDARVLDRGRATFTATGSAWNETAFRAAGEYAATADTIAVRLDTLTLAVGDSSRWHLLLPTHVRSTPDSLVVDTLLLGNGRAQIAGSAIVPAALPARGHLRAERMPLADVGVLAQMKTPLAGRLGFDVDLGGTRAAPTLALTGEADSLTIGGLTAEAMRVTGRYADRRAALDAKLVRGGRSILDASVDYPIALTLFSAEATGDSLRGHIHADSVDLALVEALSPKLQHTSGRLALDLAVSGQPSHPHVGGLATIRGGTIEVPSVGLRFAGIEMWLAVDPRRDSLTIGQLRWTSPASGGSATLKGSIVFRDPHDPRLDLRLDARELRAVDKGGLARLDVSTGPTGLTLRGGEEEARLAGEVNVDRGTIYIPELVNKRLEDFTQEEFAELFDTTDVRNRSLMPQPPGRFVEHLRLDGVSVNVGDEVWLRSSEANIKLGGSLNVTRARDERETRRSSLERAGGDSALYRLALSGTLSADRGTYTLDLGLVQREFQVQSGRITFFGTADFNPSIDVTALYRVKQSRRTDIDVQARIVGPFFPQPSLELSSDDAFISQTDLVAYLVTGRPSYELNASNAAAVQRAAEVMLPTTGAWLSRALRDQLGGWVDLFQIQTGTLDQTSASQSGSAQDQFRSVLSGTRLGGEKQISDRLFLSFSTGLCQLGSSTDKEQQGMTGFVNSIEGKLEYRFPITAPDQLSLRAGREPAASALRCGATGSLRGFVSTPQQWGISLFRSWSF